MHKMKKKADALKKLSEDMKATAQDSYDKDENHYSKMASDLRGSKKMKDGGYHDGGIHGADKMKAVITADSMEGLEEGAEMLPEVLKKADKLRKKFKK